ncbi:MAG: hypothetical protein N2Z60_08260, partial [Elusimicrobiales bacterium]|nr:hypothetical protein [Elusimicrobiales bacterium]
MNWLKIFGQTEDGSTERLVQYSFLYFAMYVIYTMMTKRMQLAYGVDGTVFTVYNTMGGMLICVLVVLIFKWYKFKSSNYIKLLGINMP